MVSADGKKKVKLAPIFLKPKKKEPKPEPVAMDEDDEHKSKEEAGKAGEEEKAESDTEVVVSQLPLTTEEGIDAWYNENFIRTEVFEDNHGTTDLNALVPCPAAGNRTVAVVAFNQFQVLDWFYKDQYFLVHSCFFNGEMPNGKWPKRGVKAKDISSEKRLTGFAWACDPKEEPIKKINAVVGTVTGQVKRFKVNPGAQEIKPFPESHDAAVDRVVTFKGGKLAATLSTSNGKLRVWDFETNTCLHREEAKHLRWLAPGPDQNSILLGYKRAVKKLVVGAAGEEGSVETTLIVKPDADLRLCEMFSETQVLIVTTGRLVSIWSISPEGWKKGTSWKSQNLHPTSPDAFCFDPETGVCGIGGMGGLAELRNVQTGRLYKRFTGDRPSTKTDITHTALVQGSKVLLAAGCHRVFKYTQAYYRKNKGGSTAFPDSQRHHFYFADPENVPGDFYVGE